MKGLLHVVQSVAHKNPTFEKQNNPRNPLQATEMKQPVTMKVIMLLNVHRLAPV